MSDGRTSNGGARAGAGRKPKALEEDLRARLQKALKGGRKNSLDEIFAQLVEDCTSQSFRVRHAARAMLFDRLYGKATPPVAEENEAADGSYIVRVPVRLSVGEWQQQVQPPVSPPKK